MLTTFLLSRGDDAHPLRWLLGFTPAGLPLLTAGGVYFIGATTDRYFRAFDSASGAELWRQRIPFNANAIPMTYRLRPDSRQFVVVAAGGNQLTTIGDAPLAFALPEPTRP